MSAHHVKHATTCPARGTGELRFCSCGAPGSDKAKERNLAMLPGELVDAVERAGAPAPRDGRFPAPARSRIGSGYPGGGRADPPFDPAPTPATLNTSKALAELVDGIEEHVTALLGRKVAIEASRSNGYASLEIRQRCAACRAEIVRQVPNDARLGAEAEAERVRMSGELGKAARLAYLKHGCAPVAQNYNGLTDVELLELEQDLERDGFAMLDRVAEIRKLREQRQAGEHERIARAARDAEGAAKS